MAVIQRYSTVVYTNFEVRDISKVVNIKPEANLQDVFVQFAKCICLICKMYMFNLQDVFAQFAKCICSIW